MPQTDAYLDHTKLRATAERVSWHAYKMTPSKLGNIAIRMPAAEANRVAQLCIQSELDQLPPGVSVPEHLKTKLKDIYQSVADETGVPIEDLPGYSTVGHLEHAGVYSPLFHHALLMPPNKEGIASDQIAMFEVMEESALVHEIAHGALERGVVHQVVVVTPKAVSGKGNIVVSDATGLRKTYHHGSSGHVEVGNIGSFFSEARAESIANRYTAAKRLVPQPNDPFPYTCTTLDGDEIRVDPRYVLTVGNLYSVLTPALAANSVGLLDECRAIVDPASRSLHTIMKDAQSTSTQLAAQKELIATINIIQPGLYRTVMGLSHTEQDLVHALRLARQLHSQLVPHPTTRP